MIVAFKMLKHGRIVSDQDLSSGEQGAAGNGGGNAGLTIWSEADTSRPNGGAMVAIHDRLENHFK